MRESNDVNPDPLGSPLARAAFEASTECLIILAPDGVVIAVNLAFCELYGIRAEETVGHHYMGFSKDFEIRRFGDPLDYPNWVTANALNGQRVRNIVQGVRNKITGRDFFGRYGATPVFEDGQFVATIITVLDITEATHHARSLSAALSAAEVGTWRADVQEGKVWADENYARLCGMEPDELQGASLSRLYKLIHPEDRQRALQAFREASESGAPHEVEYRIVLPDGTIRWLVSRGIAAHSDSGELRERIGSIVDLTRQKESEEMLRNTTDAIPVMVSYLDADLVYRFCNGAYERFFDQPREELVGRFVGDVLGPEAFAAAGPYLRRALQGEDASFSMRKEYPRLGWRDVQVEYRPRVRVDGQIEGVYALIVDETDRKMAERALKQSGETFERLVKNSPLGIYAVDADFRLVLVSEGAQRVFENVRPLIGRDFSEVMRTIWEEPFASEAIALFRHTLETGEPYHAPSTLERRQDIAETESYDWKIERVVLPDGRFGVVCNFYDLSERQRYEAALYESEQLYRATFENAAVGMAHVGLDGRWLRFNDALAEILGYSREELKDKTFGDVTHAEDVDADWAQARRLISGEIGTYTMEKRYVRKDGQIAWVNLTASVVRSEGGEPLYFVSVVEDVTARKKTERALREGEAQYRQIAEGLPQMVWSARPDGVRDYFNARWLDYTGVGPDNDPNPWLAVLHPEDRDRALAGWEKAIRGDETFQAEYRLRAKEGRYRWFLGRAIAIRNVAGEIVRWFGTCTDIEEQKAAQRVLEITNEFAQTLAADLDLDRIVQALTDASTLAVGAQFGSFFYNVVNEAGEAYVLYTLAGALKEAFEQFGMPRATAVFGPTFRGEGIVRSDDITKDPRYGSMAPHYGMPRGHLPVVSYLAVPVISRSGEVIGGIFFGHPEPGIFTAEHEGVVASFAAQAAVAMDNARLYERVTGMNEELEQQVRARTADLQATNEALRGFTYHVSHDLRAPLRTISSSSRIVQEDFGTELPAEAHAILSRQAEAAGRLGQLIDDLLKLSRLSQAELRRASIDFTALAYSVASEAMGTHPDSSVRVIVANGLVAEADPNLLRLALGNLIENAVKYSPNGGTVRVSQRADGSFSVSDEGIGIDPRYFDKIFEPFQRLHRDEEFAGTGIGLSNVRQVVERHGGKVWVESELGAGSTFVFTLE